MSRIELDRLTVRELLALWAGTLRELRDRGVVRTFNNPIGDLAESLVAEHYGGERASFAQKDWDVRVGDDRLQVKAIRLTGVRTRRALSTVRSDDGYTAVVVVIFDGDLRIQGSIRIPRQVVNDLFPRRSHVNGRIIVLGRRLYDHPDVTPVSISDEILDL